ncbi:aminotransferase class V-fold PLP-dependent enzyme [Gordonibacter sp. 28C]|uniref:aminotransferase class V-fold PLP-dependent enzyme n=1 Tax=Gordonibacter sp. 28C TaxID=2078569 RepID=UPI001F542C70|nr:SufS family cysteine desulfurase [Gordonibacter sp. 28C]
MTPSRQEDAEVPGAAKPFAPGTPLRAAFPLLAASDERGEGLAYLDNAATTQKPACVLDAADAFYRSDCANPHRSTHRLARRATEALESARAELARFAGADANEIVLTSGATHALNLAAFGYGATALKPGDEIVVSLLEHHSNLVPWQAVARITGARLVPLVPDRAGRISDAEVDRTIGPRTRIVAVTATSNVLGCAPPVERIARAARACGAVVVLDCAQSVAHEPLDVRALDVDFAAFSGHKMYGPMGTGVLYGRRELLERTAPLLRGGGMVDRVFEQAATFDEAPCGLEAGTQNVAGAAGMAEAARFLSRIGFDAVRAHERALTRRMVEGLAALPSVKLYGPGPNDRDERHGIVAFNVRGVDAAATAQVLDRRGVAVRAGTHCAQPLLRHLGTDAVCRASVGVYNDEGDVDRFLEAAENAQREAVALMTSAML